MVFSYTSLDVGTGTTLLPGRVRRAIFFFGLIFEVSKCSQGDSLEGLENGDDRELKGKKFLESTKDRKSSIYTSLKG